MPTIVGILTFMSRKNFMLSSVEHEKCIITSGPSLYEGEWVRFQGKSLYHFQFWFPFYWKSTLKEKNLLQIFLLRENTM